MLEYQGNHGQPEALTSPLLMMNLVAHSLRPQEPAGSTVLA
jgi:hypothetical protein